MAMITMETLRRRCWHYDNAGLKMHSTKRSRRKTYVTGKKTRETNIRCGCVYSLSCEDMENSSHRDPKSVFSVRGWDSGVEG